MIYYIVAYLIGSIPSALIVGRHMFNIDIREHGSNNPGATNTFRVLGKKAAITVLIVDIGKGAIAAALPYIFNLDIEPLYLGLVAVIGHCFPIFARFRGGKAIATTAGALLVSNPLMLLVAYICFISISYFTKYVFLGSLSVGVSLLIYSIIVPDTEFELIFVLYTLLLIYVHRSNIRNFLQNKELKINDEKVKEDRIRIPKK